VEASRNFALSLAVVFLGALLMPHAALAQSYNAAAVFEGGWANQQNPNGVWSYGYSSGFTEPVTLYNAIQTGNPVQTHLWVSPKIEDGYSPNVGLNDGPAYNNGNLDFLANELILTVGIGGQYSDLVFTAPATAAYSIASEFRGAQYRIGTVVGVVANGKVLFSSKVTSVGQLVPFSAQVSLKAGDTLVFSAGPGGGLQNTGISAIITVVPCTLKDTLTYDLTTKTLTMNFTVGNNAAATWNAWLTSGNDIKEVFSISQPITKLPVSVTKTTTLSPEGTVGVLSTLTTPTGGIYCSSYVQVNTGTP